PATGQIALFRFTHETGAAAGIRRIEAVTGPAAYALVRKLEQQFAEAAGTLKAQPEHLTKRIETLLEENRKLERRVEELLRSGGRPSRPRGPATPPSSARCGLRRPPSSSGCWRDDAARTAGLARHPTPGAAGGIARAPRSAVERLGGAAAGPPRRARSRHVGARHRTARRRPRAGARSARRRRVRHVRVRGAGGSGRRRAHGPGPAGSGSGRLTSLLEGRP